MWKNTKNQNLSFKIRHFIKPSKLTLRKNPRWYELRYITCRPELYNFKTRKKLKTYLIVRIKLSLNETGSHK